MFLFLYIFAWVFVLYTAASIIRTIFFGNFEPSDDEPTYQDLSWTL